LASIGCCAGGVIWPVGLLWLEVVVVLVDGGCAGGVILPVLGLCWWSQLASGVVWPALLVEIFHWWGCLAGGFVWPAVVVVLVEFLLSWHLQCTVGGNSDAKTYS